MPKISGIQILVLVLGLRVQVAPSSGSFHFLRPRGVFLHWYGVLGVVSIWDGMFLHEMEHLVFWMMYLLISQKYEDLRVYSLNKTCPFHAL